MGLYDTTIGTLLVGIFFNTFLYGLVTYQFALYSRMKFNDRPALKYAVLFLFILDTFHSASTGYMAWYYTVTNFGNPAALSMSLWPYAFTPFGFAFAALVTHIYLAVRIWRLTSSKFLYGMAVLLASISFILGMITSVEGWIIHVMSELPRITSLVVSWLSMQVVADLFITTTLVIAFSRSRTGFRKTDTILNRLIRGAIQTGLFASIFSLGDLVCFVIFPSTDLFGMFAIPIGRIYTNTLLDTLINREMLKVEADGTEATSRCAMFDSVYLAPTGSQAISTFQSTSTQIKSQGTSQGTCHYPSADDEEKVASLQT